MVRQGLPRGIETGVFASGLVYRDTPGSSIAEC